MEELNCATLFRTKEQIFPQKPLLWIVVRGGAWFLPMRLETVGIFCLHLSWLMGTT